MFYLTADEQARADEVYRRAVERLHASRARARDEYREDVLERAALIDAEQAAIVARYRAARRRDGDV